MPVVERGFRHDSRSHEQSVIPTSIKRQIDLLANRYDLGDNPAQHIFTDRKKPLQGVYA
jgi:hypothetical protein